VLRQDADANFPCHHPVREDGIKAATPVARGPSFYRGPLPPVTRARTSGLSPSCSRRARHLCSCPTGPTRDPYVKKTMHIFMNWLTATHTPRRVPGGLDRTKVFHVKHFGAIDVTRIIPSPREVLSFGRDLLSGPRCCGWVGYARNISCSCVQRMLHFSSRLWGKIRQSDSIAACAALESGMTHISGFERSQLLLLPEAVDDDAVAGLNTSDISDVSSRGTFKIEDQDRRHCGLREGGDYAVCSQAATGIIGEQWLFPQG
jgi:hypothetical protein